MATTSFLDLDTLANRPIVKIDGVAYPLRATEDFSILEWHRHGKEVTRFAELMNQADLTDAEGQELSILLASYCQRVLNAPADVHAKLTDGHRLRIVTVFSQLLGIAGLTLGARTARPKPTLAKTGAAPSLDSVDSTEEIH